MSVVHEFFEAIDSKDLIRIALSARVHGLHVCDDGGNTPLYRAIKTNDSATVQLLLDLGAFVDERTSPESDWTCLLSCAELGHTEAAKVLLSAGANINYQDVNGNTPLIIATYHNMYAFVSLMLEHNAYLHLRDQDNCTAGDIARAKGYAHLDNILKEPVYG